MADGGPVVRVGVVAHVARPGIRDTAEDLVSWLRGRGVATRGLKDEAVEADEAVSPSEFADGLDLVVSVGGDGTLLRAAQLANSGAIPVLGVRAGRLGFLTEVDPEGAPVLLEEMLAGRAVIEERMAIEAEPVNAPWVEPQWALNEVIVEKRARHRLITLAVLVGAERVTTFSADGVIVATPTGSTAYSFSARGPIVEPRLQCLVVTPVSPHMVFDRAIVLPADATVTLRVLGEEAGLLSADGRESLELPIGADVRIRRAARPCRLVRGPSSAAFFALLREKFSLPGEAPHGATHRDVGPGR